MFVLWIDDPSVQQGDATHIERRHLLREFEAADAVEADVDVESILKARKQLDDSVQLILRGK